jgi:hypothetical protein
MNTYPFTQENKNQEWIVIEEILKNYGYQQSIINSKNTNRFYTNHTKTQKEEEKEKWATFTYVGPETRSITNLFWHTNLNISYRTTNTIEHHLKHRDEPRDIYNQSGIY